MSTAPGPIADLAVDTPPRSRSRFSSPWMLGVALINFVALIVPCVTHETFTCAICHAKQHERRFFGIGIGGDDKFKDTECSIWYRENVEPRHGHVWCRGPGQVSYNVIGIPYTSISSGKASGPIAGFGAAEALLVYQNCPDQGQAREVFLRLAKWEPYETLAYKNQREIGRQLRRWLDAYCREPWPFDGLKIGR